MIFKICFFLYLSILNKAVEAFRLKPSDLLVESLSQPEGIDIPFPRYSWFLDPVTSLDRDLIQYAFEIQLTIKPYFLLILEHMTEQLNLILYYWRVRA